MAWRYCLRGFPGERHRRLVFHLPLDRKAGAGRGERSGSHTATIRCVAQHRDCRTDTSFDMTKEQRKFRPLTLAAFVMAALSLFAAIIYGVQLTLHPAAAQLPTARNGMARVGDFSLLGSDCNIARDSIPALKQLREQFAKHDEGFLMKVGRRFAGGEHGFL